MNLLHIESKNKFSTAARLSARDIKARISPVDFYSRELPDMPPPRGVKWECGGLCPFHQDRSRGSFKVNSESGAFRCFSCGANGGDIIDFRMKFEHVDFRQALESIANDWGVR